MRSFANVGVLHLRFCRFFLYGVDLVEYIFHGIKIISDYACPSYRVSPHEIVFAGLNTDPPAMQIPYLCYCRQVSENWTMKLIPKW